MSKSTTSTQEINFKVQKRDGRIVEFNPERIETGIFKAADSVGGDDRKRAKEVSQEVVKRLSDKFEDKDTVTTEDIADVVKENTYRYGTW